MKRLPLTSAGREQAFIVQSRVHWHLVLHLKIHRARFSGQPSSLCTAKQTVCPWRFPASTNPAKVAPLASALPPLILEPQPPSLAQGGGRRHGRQGDGPLYTVLQWCKLQLPCCSFTTRAGCHKKHPQPLHLFHCLVTAKPVDLKGRKGLWWWFSLTVRGRKIVSMPDWEQYLIDCCEAPEEFRVQVY